jgi:3-oxoadipate enol-lactonase
LVILHSLLTDSKAFDRVIPKFPNRVLSFDLPGFAETDPTGPSIDEFAGLMSSAVDVLVGDEGPPIVMGNGLGSFVALGMAIDHPETVGRLVLVGCGATFPDQARPAFGTMIDLVESGGMSAVTPIALRRIFTEEYLESHPEEAELRARVLERTDPSAFVHACRALQEVDFTDRVPRVKAPTLLVVGEDDQATPPAMAAELDELLPESMMVTLPGVAHAPQLQDSAGFIDAVSRFLEGA